MAVTLKSAQAGFDAQNPAYRRASHFFALALVAMPSAWSRTPCAHIRIFYTAPCSFDPVFSRALPYFFHTLDRSRTAGRVWTKAGGPLDIVFIFLGIGLWALMALLVRGLAALAPGKGERS
jgi:hypothetical protein